MSIRIRPWGSTNPDDELDVTETGLPQDTSALVAGGYEVGRIAWEGVQRTIPVPALSSATDAADGSTASTGSVSTTIGDGTLYWVITQSATSPSIAQVKAGQNHTGAAADDSGSQAVSATGVQNMAGSGLTGSTTYYTHFMHEDSAANQSTVASADGFTTSAAATVPAAMSAPTVTAVSDTEISVDRAAAPSDGGSPITSYDLRWEVDGSGSWTTVTGIGDPQSVTGLTASTLYNVQTRAVNAVGAGAWSSSGSATTDAGAASIADQIIAELGSDLVALYDMTDFTKMFQDTAGTTAVTAAGQDVKRLVDVSGNGHHATASAFAVPGNGVSGAGFVNVNEAGFKIAGSLTGAAAAMEVYLRFNRGSDTVWCLLGKDNASTHAIGTAWTGNSSDTFGGFSGTITDTVNGVTVSPQTRSALYNAVVAAGGYCTQGVHGVDLTGQVDIMPMAYQTGATRLAANAKFFLITKALTPTKRTNLHAILENA